MGREFKSSEIKIINYMGVAIKVEKPHSYLPKWGEGLCDLTEELYFT
jgi:hypothetical protein